MSNVDLPAFNMNNKHMMRAYDSTSEGAKERYLFVLIQPTHINVYISLKYERVIKVM